MSVTLRYGRGAFIGTAAEVTWGTPVAATHFYRVIGTSLTRKVGKVGRPHLTHASVSAMRKSHFTTEDLVEGSFEVELNYEGMGTLFYHALGAKATTGPSGSTYTHTYTLAAELPVGLTIEQCIGVADDGTYQSEVFEGCRINTAKVRFAAGEVARGTFDVIGETSAARTTASSPTYTTNDTVMLHHQAGTLSFNSVSYTAKTVEITVENNLARRMLLGSTVTKQPQRSDFTKVTIRATLELTSAALITAYTADTQGDLVIAFTGTGVNTATWTAQNGFITSYSDPISSPGIIEQVVEWTCESDGTDEGLKLVITNLQATAILLS